MIGVLSLLTSIVLTGIGFAIQKSKQKEQDLQTARTYEQQAKDLITDAGIAQDYAEGYREQAEGYREQAEDLEDIFQSRVENMMEIGRAKEDDIREQLSSIIAKQRVGTAASGFKTNSATTTVLAQRSTKEAQKDIGTMWGNIEGERKTMYNQLTAEQKGLYKQADWLENEAGIKEKEAGDFLEKSSWLIGEADILRDQYNIAPPDPSKIPGRPD